MDLTFKLNDINRFLVLLIFMTPLLSFSQTTTYTGVYEMRYELSNGGLLERTLSLNLDSTFLFHQFKKLDTSQPEENKYAKGVWKVEKENIIYFYTDQNTDLDETHSLNFNNTKARYHSKSKRDKSGRLIKKTLNFFASDIFWVKSMKLTKKE